MYPRQQTGAMYADTRAIHARCTLSFNDDPIAWPRRAPIRFVVNLAGFEQSLHRDLEIPLSKSGLFRLLRLGELPWRITVTRFSAHVPVLCVAPFKERQEHLLRGRLAGGLIRRSKDRFRHIKSVPVPQDQ